MWRTALTLMLGAIAGGLLASVPARAVDPPLPPATPAPPAESTEAVETEEIDLGEIAVEGAAPPTLPPETTQPPADAAVPMAARAADQALVISQEQLQASGASTLSELLAQTPGFTVSESFSGQAATFQGLPGKFAAVLIDGQRLPGGVQDRVDFGQLPLEAVERVEVLRGPQALAYGAGIGAVVNLITADGRSGETKGELALGTGSFGWQRHGLALRGGTDDGTEGWSLSVDRRARSAYDLDTRQPNTDGDSQRQFNIRAVYNRDYGPNSLQLRLDSFTEFRRGLTFAPPNLTRNNDTSTQRLQLGGTWRWGLARGGSLELRQDYGNGNHSLRRYYPGFEATTAQETGFGDRLLDTHLDYRQRGDGRGLAAGLQFSQDRLRSGRISAAGAITARAHTVGVYGGYAWDLGRRWQATAAARLDAPSSFGTTVSPQATLRYELDDDATLGFTAARGHRTPSLREQYYEFDSPFGYSVIGNTSLRPESSWDYNLDYDYAGAGTALHAGAFLHDVRDLIDFSQIQSSPQVFQTVNIGNARTYGAELSAQRRWHLGGPGRSWGLGVSTSYLPHAADESTGLRLPNSPQWNSTARLFYNADAHDLSAQLLLHALGSRYLDAANTDLAPGFATLDATLSRQVGSGRLRLSALNLFDRRDGKYGPEPGRELRAEYSYGF